MDKLDLSSQESRDIGIKQSSIFSNKAVGTKVVNSKSEIELGKKLSSIIKKVDPAKKSKDVQAEKNEASSNKLQQASEAFDENREKLRRRMENMFSSVKSSFNKK